MVDDAVFKVGMVMLVAGFLVGVAAWSPAYAVAVAGLLLVVLSQAL